MNLFTGLHDTDLMILYELDIKSLVEICLTTTCTSKLLNDKDFWLNKFRYNNINVITDYNPTDFNPTDFRGWYLYYKYNNFFGDLIKAKEGDIDYTYEFKCVHRSVKTVEDIMLISYASISDYDITYNNIFVNIKDINKSKYILDSNLQIKQFIFKSYRG